MIVLDTSSLIDYFRGVEKIYNLINDEDVAIATITYHEILIGLKRKKKKGSLKILF